MRTFVVSSIVIGLAILAWSPGTIAEHPPVRRGEMRIVDKRPENRFTIEHNRIEALVRYTDDGTLVPSLARSWHCEREKGGKRGQIYFSPASSRSTKRSTKGQD